MCLILLLLRLARDKCATLDLIFCDSLGRACARRQCALLQDHALLVGDVVERPLWRPVELVGVRVAGPDEGGPVCDELFAEGLLNGVERRKCY